MVYISYAMYARNQLVVPYVSLEMTHMNSYVV